MRKFKEIKWVPFEATAISGNPVAPDEYVVLVFADGYRDKTPILSDKVDWTNSKTDYVTHYSVVVQQTGV